MANSIGCGKNKMLKGMHGHGPCFLDYLFGRSGRWFLFFPLHWSPDMLHRLNRDHGQLSSSYALRNIFLITFTSRATRKYSNRLPLKVISTVSGIKVVIGYIS